MHMVVYAHVCIALPQQTLKAYASRFPVEANFLILLLPWSFTSAVTVRLIRDEISSVVSAVFIPISRA